MLCGCRMFEQQGLVCRHMIRMRELLGHNGRTYLLTLPPEYILPRFSRKAKDRHIDAEPLIEVRNEVVAKYQQMNTLMAS
ncbi:Protein FAR1-RELATED SEQUENCE 5, partial [Linum grandiflorum]